MRGLNSIFVALLMQFAVFSVQINANNAQAIGSTVKRSLDQLREPFLDLLASQEFTTKERVLERLSLVSDEIDHFRNKHEVELVEGEAPNIAEPINPDVITEEVPNNAVTSDTPALQPTIEEEASPAVEEPSTVIEQQITVTPQPQPEETLVPTEQVPAETPIPTPAPTETETPVAITQTNTTVSFITPTSNIPAGSSTAVPAAVEIH